MKNESAPTASPGKRRLMKRIILGIFILLLLIGGGAYVASRFGLDKALVTQQLDGWIARAEEKAKEEGVKLDIAYDSITLAGGFTDRHAIIRNLRVTVGGQGMPYEPQETRTYRTAEMQFFPRSHDMQDFSLRLPAPLEMTENQDEHPTMTLISDTPLAFEVEQMTRADGEYYEVTHPLPALVTLRYFAGQEASGEEEATPELSPRYDAVKIEQQGGVFRYLANKEDSAIGTTEFRAENIRVIPVGMEQETVKIAGLSLDYRNQINAEKKNDVTVDISLDNLSAAEEYLPHTPFSAKIAFAFEGALPETPEQLAATGNRETAFKLEDFSLHTKDANIDATADFITKGDDILPIGTATVTFTNIPSWRNFMKDYELITAPTEELINTILLRTADTRLVDAGDVTLNIQRVRGGAFEIGNSTFEEVLAILMGNMKTPLDAPAPKPTAETTAPQNEAAPEQPAESAKEPAPAMDAPPAKPEQKQPEKTAE